MRRLRCIVGLHAWTPSVAVTSVSSGTVSRVDWSCGCGACRSFILPPWSTYWRDLGRNGEIADRWGSRCSNAMSAAYASHIAGGSDIPLSLTIPMEVR